MKIVGGVFVSVLNSRGLFTPVLRFWPLTKNLLFDSNYHDLRLFVIS